MNKSLLDWFLLILAVCARGVALNFLWSWFVVPLGVREINVPWAIGLLLTVLLVLSRKEVRSWMDVSAHQCRRRLLFNYKVDAGLLCLGFLVYCFV